MDPVTVLGIAGTIVQFVDFGIRVVSKGNQIYRSGDGSLDENHDLEIVTNDLLVLQTKLDQAGQRDGLDARPTEDEVILRRLSTTANELARTLLTRLNMVKAQGRFRRWKSFRQAIKSVSSQKEIDSMARRLTMLKDELQMQILVLLKDKLDIFACQQSHKLDLLDRSSKNLLAALQENRGTSHIDKAPEMGLSKDVPRQNPEESKNKPGVIADNVLKFSSALKGERQGYAQRPESNGSQSCGEFKDAILRSLSFSTMESRHDAVAGAHRRTFSWIFEDPRGQDQPWDNYGQWLQRGNNIYWLNGKAASGKSTLMKYLISHPDTENFLRVWSGPTPLLCANFFFWNTGTSMQKSQAGLLRSLLYQVFTEMCLKLNKTDSVMRRVMPEMWDRLMVMQERAVEKSKARNEPVDKPLPRLRESWYSWTLSELREAFGRLMQETDRTFKLCFFIDGLDEFDGDHAEIVNFFKHVASFPNAKLCASSRPLLIFEHEFETFPKFRLQDLTRNDIKQYAHDKLSDHGRILQLSRRDPTLLGQLVTEILDMSSGVFLWVTLAVRSLLKGFTNSDSMFDLQKRLRELPPELDDLYSLMLRSIQPKFYIEQASRLFQIVYQADSPISALALSFADNADTQLSLKARIRCLSDTEKNSRVEAIASRLKSRCAGLLELSMDLKDSLVQYLHLTVKEFLEKAEVWRSLMNSTKGTDFDANVSLLRSDVFLLKSRGLGWSEPDWKLIDGAMCHALQAENSTGKAQTALLDELDRIGHSMVKLGPRSNRHERNLHWSAAMHSIDQRCHNCPESFLTFAISNGLALYTRSKLGHSVQAVNRQTVRPLLAYATGCLPPYQKRKMTSLHPPMLAMLLRGGLGPNEPFQGSTPWRKILSHILTQSEFEGVNLESSWLDVCKLFLMHGADPIAYVKTAEAVQPRASAPEIIEIAFAHLPRHLVDEVKTTLLQQSALASSKRKVFHYKRKYESDSEGDNRPDYHYKKSRAIVDPGHHYRNQWPKTQRFYEP